MTIAAITILSFSLGGAIGLFLGWCMGFKEGQNKAQEKTLLVLERMYDLDEGACEVMLAAIEELVKEQDEVEKLERLHRVS